jgi:hypothetical protein
MKKLAIFGLLLSLGFGSTLPANANDNMPKSQQESTVLDTYRHNNSKCFKLKKDTIIVPYNLTQKQEDFIKVARFSTPEALENYIVINSINNTFRSCLKRSSKVPGFTRKATNYLGYTYYSTKTNVTLINGNDKKVIQGAVEVEVRYKRNGTISINAKRTA